MESWKTDNKRAMAILRVSSHRQKDNSSHDVQESEIREYCEKNGLDLVQVENIVESAKTSKGRIKYKTAIQSALKTKIQHVLFYMYDRESRNLTDNEANEDLVRNGALTIHYVRDRKVLHRESSDSDFLIRDMHAINSKQFIRNLTAKVNDAMRAKAESGWYPSNHPPLGYVLQKRKDEAGRELKRGAIVVADPDEKRIVQVLREFELRAAGYSYDAIRMTILSEGLVPQRDARAYHASSIERRLKSPFYRGKFYWQGMEYPGKHPQIIPTDLLRAVDRTFQGRRPTRTINAPSGAFSGGWLTCAECGCNVVYDPKKKLIKATNEVRVHRYYHCTNGKRFHKSMKGMTVSEETLWSQFVSAVDTISINDEFAQLIAEAMNETHSKTRETIQSQASGYKKALADLERREDSAYEFLTNGTIDEDMFKRQLNHIREQRQSYTNRLTEVNLAITDAGMETAKSILDLAANARKLWDTLGPFERRDSLELLLSNPVLDRSTVRYDLKKPFALLAEMKGSEEWRSRVGEFRTACVGFASNFSR